MPDIGIQTSATEEVRHGILLTRGGILCHVVPHHSALVDVFGYRGLVIRPIQFLVSDDIQHDDFFL